MGDSTISPSPTTHLRFRLPRTSNAYPGNNSFCPSDPGSWRRHRPQHASDKEVFRILRSNILQVKAAPSPPTLKSAPSLPLTAAVDLCRGWGRFVDAL